MGKLDLAFNFPSELDRDQRDHDKAQLRLNLPALRAASANVHP
jgi:hypothetical protein